MAQYDVYGAVVVKGEEYQDLEIVNLVGKPITGWKVAGDVPLKEADIVVVVKGKSKVFAGRTMLKDALAYIKEVGVDKFKASKGKTPVAKSTNNLEALLKKYKSETIKAIKAMSPAARKKLVDTYGKWFDVDWDESEITKKEAISTPQSLQQLLWDTDQVASDGGLLDFLVENKILKETPEQKAALEAPAKKTAKSETKPRMTRKMPAKGQSSAEKKAAKNAEMVKRIKPALAKLKKMKSVQQYIKLSKALTRMNG